MQSEFILIRKFNLMSNLEKFKKVRAERDSEVDEIIRVNRKSSAQFFVDQVLARFNEQKA